MGNTTRLISAYRLGKWVQMRTDELLPGDIVSLRSQPLPVPSLKGVKKSGNRTEASSTQNEDDVLSPCDLLLLSGRLVCDEALLTGESVPQVRFRHLFLNLSIIYIR